MFIPERGEWRRLRNEELHNLYGSPDSIRMIKSRRMRWAGHVARMGEMSDSYKILVVNVEGKRPLGRPRRRWEVINSMTLGKMLWEGVDWIHLSQDRDQWRALVNTVMNIRVQ
jgi:hypothetical protein